MKDYARAYKYFTATNETSKRADMFYECMVIALDVGKCRGGRKDVLVQSLQCSPGFLQDFGILVSGFSSCSKIGPKTLYYSTGCLAKLCQK